MYKPPLYSTDKKREMISTFKGYVHKPVIDENEFFYEENLSSDAYPIIAPRKKRAFFNVTGDGLHGLFSKKKIVYVNNGRLYYGGEPFDGIELPPVDGERFFVSMGTRLIIFPDKLYINTENPDEFGSLEAFFEGEKAQCTLCRGDGDLYEGYSVGASPPENPSHGALWVDTSLTEHQLKQYSAETLTWVELEDKYIRISCPEIGKSFKEYDSVELEGFEAAGLVGNHIIYDKGDDYIVVAGLLDTNVEINTHFCVSRIVPDMDFVCESGNRLWGCSSKTNEIFASKLGDPTNFYTYMGISTDSYTASVGSDGDFTGVISYRGYILFFKENCVHKIYGSNPPYTITSSYIRGVQKGSHRSLLCLNETLYYKSPKGICSFEGGVPVEVSADLGSGYYTDAVAGALNNKYYICMTNVNSQRELFVYDEEYALWHREGLLDVKAFANNNMNLYFIAEIDGERRLGLIDGENRYGNFTGALMGYHTESDCEWLLETGLWGLELPENKYYTNIRIRAIGEKGASLKVYIQYNSDGRWLQQLVTPIEKTGSVNLPFITPRCDHLKLRIQGKGSVRIISISRNVESGSEIDV
ncbi:MAG: hypothetical protein IIX14_06500 [Clostridia bacterium]|nr:hypothetical protein [Clostridia bacterium]